ncbi:hypothetical protein GCM10010441_17650 [Kitasatospora paracochleata]|uniref:Uncharacterized protein n=1 Tax=Kitasatospora paracochleata TaxID=58354 RepID=A0ABT1J9S0_9ACTN|nr:hypothetical protein [Kitasatospora paracochleata]MCP2314202.1 hypothetical protein [Kitasatospora paracochleata]
MTFVQSILQFIVEAVVDPSGTQADHLAHAVYNIGHLVSGTANAVGAVRKLRAHSAVEQPATRCCCGPCPLHPEAGAE